MIQTKKPLKILCVIPSRIGSTRMFRKPLVQLKDRTMVEWVYGAASACPDIDKTIVATDSQEIAEVVQRRGAHVEITDPSILTGSDRVAVISSRFPEYDVVINLQGDEPFMKPEMLSQLIAPFKDSQSVKMATLCFPLNFEKFYHSSDAVKVLVNQKKQALIFSRAPIPHLRDSVENLPVYHHMGIYAFEKNFLAQYTQLPQTPLEKAEKLEQLRALENGMPIYVEVVDYQTLEINTEQELIAAREKIEQEALSAYG